MLLGDMRVQYECLMLDYICSILEIWRLWIVLILVLISAIMQGS
jgi:hypothetical protein